MIFWNSVVPSILSDSTTFFVHFKAPGHPKMRQKHAKKCHRNSMPKLMSKSIVSEQFCLILGCPWTSIWGPRGHPKNVIMISVLWIGVCTLLGVLGGTPKMQMRTFFFKNHVFCEGDFQNLAFRLRAGPKEPQKYTKRTLKTTPRITHAGFAVAQPTTTKQNKTSFFWSSRNGCKGQKKTCSNGFQKSCNAACHSGSAAQAARPFNIF